MSTSAASTTHAATRSREEMVSAARKKLKTFRAKQAHSPMSSSGNHVPRRSHSRGSSMGSTVDSVLPGPAPVAPEATRHQKRRSHSRSASIIDLNSDNLLRSVTLPSLTFGNPNQSESAPSNLGGLNRSFSFGGPKSRPVSVTPAMIAMPTSPVRVQHQQTSSRSRPSSHHRRRSSVSTRRDSVDMMGFDPATLKTLGENDKDDVAKVRERALLALEGKTPKPNKARTVPEILPHMGFSKVEIPEWKTPDVERSFEWSLSSNVKSAPFSLGPNSALAGKRDSFGKNLAPSVSTKAELAVLVEEEEEEDESAEANKENVKPVCAAHEALPTSVVESPTAESFPERASSPNARPRPASLNLKALNHAASNTIALPTPNATPSPTPVPRSLPGMKPLNLGNPSRRQSMIVLGTSSPRSSIPPARRQSLRSESRGSNSTHSSRDSLGPNPALSRLPLTPSTMSPTSMNSNVAGVEGFLQKNQEVLISRIEQLEKALAKSQRMSTGSDASTNTASSLVDEQITLIAELKSERNALVEEIANWRTRVEDLERQAALYVKRIEAERRDCFAARESVHELEAERSAWEAGRAAQEETIARAREDAAAWRAKYEEASRSECRWQTKAVNLESDARRLQMELAAARRQQLGPTASPSKNWNAPAAIAPRRFDGSVSSASTTDVDEAASGEMDMWKPRPRVPSPMQNMDVVVEEDEEVFEDSYEEPSLDEDEDESRCVEEDEDDVASDILDEVNGELSVSYSADSFTSPAQPAPLRPELSPSFKFPPPAPVPTHTRTGSMVRGWQMPRGPVAVKSHSPTKPDRFFDQLEHLYASSDDEDLPIPAGLPSPEFGTFKGDGGAAAFTFGTKRNTMGTVRGHGTRASRASISLGAFDGLGLPPFKNPKPEWIVKSDSAESAPTPNTNASLDFVSVKDMSPVSDTIARSQERTSLAGASRVRSPASPPMHEMSVTTRSSSASDRDTTPKMTKPPTFTPAPMTRPTTTTPSSNTRTLARRKPSLTRAQPTGRAPPRVPFDTSYDKKNSSPFSVSYSRTSSRSSKSRSSIAEAEAIEAAIAQARALAQQQQRQSRLTFAGLTSLIPWGAGTSGAGKANAPEEREESRPLVMSKENGTVSRETQLARLRREMQSEKLMSGPCCSRCKSDVIHL